MFASLLAGAQGATLSVTLVRGPTFSSTAGREGAKGFGLQVASPSAVLTASLPLPSPPPSPKNGIFTDAACTTPYMAGLGSLNALAATTGACTVLTGLGSTKVTLSGSTYAILAYASADCSGTAMLSFSAALNACSPSSPAGTYVRVSPTINIIGTYFGAACSGNNIGTASSINAVGTIDAPACTTAATGSILIGVSSNGASFSLKAYQTAACAGTPAVAWDAAAALACAAAAAGVSISLGDVGLALPASPSPSPTPAAVPSPSPSPAALPAAISLLGVYADSKCATPLYTLNAAASVGGCSGIVGLGSGYITTSGNNYNVAGYAGVTDCSGTALAVWSNAPLGVCTATAASSPTPGLYVMLSTALVVGDIFTTAGCAGAGLLGASARRITAVGLAGGEGACSVVNNTNSIKVAALAAAKSYAVSIYFGSATCATAALAGSWASATEATCTGAAPPYLALGSNLAPAAGAITTITGTLALTKLPSAAFTATATGYAPTPEALARLLGALQYAVAQSCGAACLVSLSSILDAASGAVLYTGSKRRLAAPSDIKMLYAVTGSPAAVVGVTSSPSASFSTLLGQSIKAAGTSSLSFADVGTTVVPAPAAAAAAGIDSLAVGLGVGLGVGIPFLIFLAWYFFGGKAAASASAPPAVPAAAPAAPAAGLAIKEAATSAPESQNPV